MSQVYETFTNQKQWKEYIQDLLDKNPNALYKAVLVVYNNQTYEEKQSGITISENNTGFSKIDCVFLTHIAHKIKRKENLTSNEFYKTRAKMKKYWKQLMIESKRNLLRKEEIEKAKKVKSYFAFDHDGQLMFIL